MSKRLARSALATLASVVAIATTGSIAHASATSAGPSEGVKAEEGVSEEVVEPGPGMEVVRSVEKTEPPADSRPGVRFGEKVTGVKYKGELCGTKRTGYVTGMGPITLELSSTKSVSRTWSATMEIKAGIVSAGVGFDVTKTNSLTMGARYNVPKKRFGHLEAYPLYDVYTYNILNIHGFKAGTGSAMQPIGFCYNKWTSK